MEFQRLKPEVIEQILNLRNSQDEIPLWYNEVQNYEDSTWDEKKPPKPKKCYILLTNICIYIFIKDLRGETTKEIFSYFDVQDVAMAHNNILVLKFKSKTFYFIIPDSGALVTNLMKHLKVLSWNTAPGQIFSLKEISSKQIFKDTPNIIQRPESLTLTRYLALCVWKEVSPDPIIIDMFKKFELDPRTKVHLPETEIPSPITVILPLSIEPFVRNITFEKFSSENLGQALNCVLSNQNKFQSLELYHYENADIKGLNARRSLFNHLDVIRIHSCATNFVKSFFESIQTVNYSIDTIVFKDIKFDSETANKFAECLQSSTFFTSLRSVAFINCQCTGMSFSDFSIKCVKSGSQFENFTLDNCFIDINDILMEMAKSETPIRHISLRKNSSFSIIGHDDAILNPSVISLDVGDSEWTEEAFISFISAVCRKHRRLPLSLAIDSSRIDASWCEIFERLPSESFLPVITELNFSYNYLDEKSFQRLLEFLETQTPLQSHSNKKLKHLNISHCFKQSKEQENETICIPYLIDFFAKRDLWGIEICGVSPRQEFIDIHDLHVLNIGDNEFNDNDIATLQKFVEDSPTLTELGLNNIQCKDVRTLIHFYETMLGYPKILGFSRLNSFFQQYGQFSDTKSIKSLLNSKRNMSTSRQRLNLFLTLSEEFSIKAADEVQLRDTDMSVNDMSLRSSLLCHTQFKNPSPSLFTLATLNTFDVSVDPVASMVAEYVETSGKNGLVPPTAAPQQEPNGLMKLPSIFSTMEIEDEDETTIDIDPTNSENQEISRHISAEIAKIFGRKIKKFDEFQAKHRRKPLRVADIITFNPIHDPSSFESDSEKDNEKEYYSDDVLVEKDQLSKSEKTQTSNEESAKIPQSSSIDEFSTSEEKPKKKKKVLAKKKAKGDSSEKSLSSISSSVPK